MCLKAWQLSVVCYSCLLYFIPAASILYVQENKHSLRVKNNIGDD